jgi:protein-histidine pros-kinase
MDEAPRLDAADLFEKLFEFSPDAVVVVDEAGAIIRANAQAEQIFGYRRQEMIGQSVEMLMPERFRAIHPEHRVHYNAEPHRRPMGAGLDLFGKRKDGTEFPVDIMLGPVETENGPLVLGVIRDLSQEKEAEEALRRSEEEMRYLEEELITSHHFDQPEPETRPLVCETELLGDPGGTSRE